MLDQGEGFLSPLPLTSVVGLLPAGSEGGAAPLRLALPPPHSPEITPITGIL